MKVQEFSRCGTPNKRSPGFPFVGCRLPVLKRYPAVQGGGAGYESHRLYNRLEYEQPHTVVWFALVREFTGVYGSLWEFTGVHGMGSGAGSGTRTGRRPVTADLWRQICAALSAEGRIPLTSVTEDQVAQGVGFITLAAQ